VVKVINKINGVNNFFSKNELIDTFFQKLRLD